MAEITCPHLLEERHRDAELSAEQNVPQQHRRDQYAESARDPRRVRAQELAHEAPKHHLDGRPVDELEGAWPGAAQQINVAEQHGVDPARREASAGIVAE